MQRWQSLDSVEEKALRAVWLIGLEHGLEAIPNLATSQSGFVLGTKGCCEIVTKTFDHSLMLVLTIIKKINLSSWQYNYLGPGNVRSLYLQYITSLYWDNQSCTALSNNPRSADIALSPLLILSQDTLLRELSPLPIQDFFGSPEKKMATKLMGLFGHIDCNLYLVDQNASASILVSTESKHLKIQLAIAKSPKNSFSVQISYG